MKKFLISLGVAAAALTAAAPASAQYYGNDRSAYGYGDRYDRGGNGYGYNDNYNRGGDVRARLDRIDQRVDRGIQRGDLTRQEASRIRHQLNYIANLERRYRVNGMSPREWQHLNGQINYLQQQVRYERRDDDQRRWR